MLLFKHSIIDFYINHFVLNAPVPKVVMQLPQGKLAFAVDSKPQPLNEKQEVKPSAAAPPVVKAKVIQTNSSQTGFKSTTSTKYAI